jgi:hypothetical protein
MARRWQQAEGEGRVNGGWRSYCSDWIRQPAEASSRGDREMPSDSGRVTLGGVTLNLNIIHKKLRAMSVIIHYSLGSSISYFGHTPHSRSISVMNPSLRLKTPCSPALECLAAAPFYLVMDRQGYHIVPRPPAPPTSAVGRDEPAGFCSISGSS